LWRRGLRRCVEPPPTSTLLAIALALGSGAFVSWP